MSAIAGCQAESKGTTSPARSCSCERDSQGRRLSRISEAVSTSSGKDLTPFYDDLCREISSRLLSHTEIDFAGSGSTLSSPCSTRMVEKSWFSINPSYRPNESLSRICYQSFMSSHAGSMVSGGTRVRSRMIRIYPTREQKNLFNQWFGVSRKVYNATVDYYNNEDKDGINWMGIAGPILKSMDFDYVKRVPYQIKKMAVRDCYMSFRNGCQKAKRTGEPFEQKFRSRKDPHQSCFIPKSALSDKGIYYTLSGNLKIKERWLLNNNVKDLRLVREYDRWYLVVPMEIGNTLLPVSENQGIGDVVAIDPGIRTFITYFSENGAYGKIGSCFSEIMSIHTRLERMISLKDKTKDKKHKRRLYRSIGKLRLRLRDLIDELHWKTINFLVRNFSVIILPTFNTSEMVKKGKRKIRKRVVKAMQSYRFFEFGERLAQKCLEYGVILIRSNEAYTSKTNSFNGQLMNIGGRKGFTYDGVYVDRDINGARNILLRAVRDNSANG